MKYDNSYASMDQPVYVQQYPQGQPYQGPYGDPSVGSSQTVILVKAAPEVPVEEPQSYAELMDVRVRLG